MDAVEAHRCAGSDRVHPWALVLLGAVLGGPPAPGQTGLRVLPIGLVQGRVDDKAPAVHHASPFADQPVTVQAVVTQRHLRPHDEGVEYGFYVQNTRSVADGDDATSDALLAIAGRDPLIPTTSSARYLPRVGHEIVLAGTVRERCGMTQLASCRLVRLVRTEVDLDRELEPVAWPHPSTLDDAARTWERHEGMRIVTPADCVVLGGRTVFGRDRDAELWIQHPQTFAAVPSACPYARRVFRDAHPLDDVPGALFDNDNPHRVCVGSLGIKGATDDPGALVPPARTFDHIANGFAATVHQRYESYSLQPAGPLSVATGIDPSANGSLPAAPPHSHFTVATFNVENLFDLRNDPANPCDHPDDPGNERVAPPFGYLPADPAEYRRKLVELAEQIADRLGAPDIVLIQEAEAQDVSAGSSLDPASVGLVGGNGTPDVLEDLAAVLRSRHGHAYQAAADRDGAGYRGLLCGFLYRDDRVQLTPPSEGHPVLGARPAIDYRGACSPYVGDVQNPKAFNAQLPADVDLSTGLADTKVFPRAVQVALFGMRNDGLGRSLYVLNNHFSSRPHHRVGQRTEQAAYNAAVVDAIRKTEPDAWIVVGGDLNVYPRPDDPFSPRPSDQLRSLYEAGLANVYDHLLKSAAENAYTYVYRGEAGTLDHLFVSASLAARLDEAWIGHFNSDWPDVHAADRPFGASDHDPVVATFRYEPGSSPVTNP